MQYVINIFRHFGPLSNDLIYMHLNAPLNRRIRRCVTSQLLLRVQVLLRRHYSDAERPAFDI